MITCHYRELIKNTNKLSYDPDSARGFGGKISGIHFFEDGKKQEYNMP
jgi:hypothetical protein